MTRLSPVIGTSTIEFAIMEKHKIASEIAFLSSLEAKIFLLPVYSRHLADCYDVIVARDGRHTAVF